MQCGRDWVHEPIVLSTLSGFSSRREISGSIHEELGYTIDAAFEAIVDGMGLVVPVTAGDGGFVLARSRVRGSHFHAGPS